MIDFDSPAYSEDDLELSAMDLTPLLDVIFMLVVFLMLTANSVPYALTLDLPKKGADQALAISDADKTTITLFPEEMHWRVNSSDVHNWQDVEDLVLAHKTDATSSKIIIQGGRDVSMEKLLEVLAFLKREGLSAAQILMDKSPHQSSSNTPK